MTNDRGMYQDVERFQAEIRLWANSMLAEELAVFADLADLMIDAIHSVPPRGDGAAGEQASMVTMLTVRMVDDFEACKRLLLSGLDSQFQMPLRDAAECSGLIAIFLLDPQKAIRWVNRLAEYQPSDVRTILREAGVTLISSNYYGALSHLAHPNLLAAVMTVKETPLGNRSALREFHLGGWKNERQIRSDAHMLLAIMSLMLHECFLNVVSAYGGDVPRYQSRVDAVGAQLKEFGITAGDDAAEDVDEDGSSDDARVSELVNKRLKIKWVRLKASKA